MALSRASMRRLSSLRPSNFRAGTSYMQPRVIQQQRVSWSQHRFTHNEGLAAADSKKSDITQQLREEWSSYNHFPEASSASQFVDGQTVTVHGFLSQRRISSKKLIFANIQVDNGPSIQIVSHSEPSDESNPPPGHEAHLALRALPLHSPVAVTGTVVSQKGSQDSSPTTNKNVPGTFPKGVTHLEISLQQIQPLNVFPKDIIVSKGVQFPPSARHLQIRFDEALQARLRVRPKIGHELRKSLIDLNFTEVETPILFKSTPEGAREFLVPTRRAGLAYALPQSPQQYKQILMSSGIRGYYQFARCFRDEDLRADRQPEFTQLDLEMSFATGQDVMRTVESIMKDLMKSLNAQFELVQSDTNERYPVPKRPSSEDKQQNPWPVSDAPFPRLTYEEAMSRFGVDKPDTRIPFGITPNIPLPASFTSMISPLPSPTIDSFLFSPTNKSSIHNITKFTHTFLSSTLPPSLFTSNPHGQPAALIIDTSKPQMGLSPLGFPGLDTILTLYPSLSNGDVLFLQARPSTPFSGGSTPLGQIRSLLYHSAISASLLPPSPTFNFLWVTNFPMFTPNDSESDPGQGGQSGFSATHHPFTAPLTNSDVDLLVSNPLAARADHYDLVLNGVELGGGSRRIHTAKMQEYVFREILQMTDKGVKQFSHLLEALRAGCPPHAGFALGFDRLCAVLTGTDSVRDVIAFPKSMKGEDLTVKSPGKITSEELGTYHLAFKPKEKKGE
ncbi:putative mitochondrial aspartyl-tRNA synthetase precursor [Triangularia verruculosa]|uniref:Mitochondrial aspartyl-tRNA synthetase n=1 Tax=Triangularia verruculosa TaxID=2587418 RepID=A0AAN6XC62_9PEZI|nr:putative mitochondrial aspartyl-tRNA synthetase precursor [Triangularia verruculosa]